MTIDVKLSTSAKQAIDDANKLVDALKEADRLIGKLKSTDFSDLFCAVVVDEERKDWP